jgi:preprotein translocase subunit YajC
MTAPAWAQAAHGAGPSPIVNLLPLALIFGVFYFLLIRPQQQKTKEHRQMLANLKRNDEVITSGGLYGKIVALNDKVVTLEIAPNVRVRVERPQISSLASEAAKPGAADDSKDKEKDKAK